MQEIDAVYSLSRFVEAFLPVIRENGKLVVVDSLNQALERIPEAVGYKEFSVSEDGTRNGLFHVEQDFRICSEILLRRDEEEGNNIAYHILKFSRYARCFDLAYVRKFKADLLKARQAE